MSSFLLAFQNTPCLRAAARGKPKHRIGRSGLIISGEHRHWLRPRHLAPSKVRLTKACHNGQAEVQFQLRQDKWLVLHRRLKSRDLRQRFLDRVIVCKWLFSNVFEQKCAIRIKYKRPVKGFRA